MSSRLLPSVIFAVVVLGLLRVPYTRTAQLLTIGGWNAKISGGKGALQKADLVRRTAIQAQSMQSMQ
jgi:hypothetical protein